MPSGVARAAAAAALPEFSAWFDCGSDAKAASGPGQDDGADIVVGNREFDASRAGQPPTWLQAFILSGWLIVSVATRSLISTRISCDCVIASSEMVSIARIKAGLDGKAISVLYAEVTYPEMSFEFDVRYRYQHQCASRLFAKVLEYFDEIQQPISLKDIAVRISNIRYRVNALR